MGVAKPSWNPEGDFLSATLKVKVRELWESSKAEELHSVKGSLDIKDGAKDCRSIKLKAESTPGGPSRLTILHMLKMLTTTSEHTSEARSEASVRE